MGTMRDVRVDAVGPAGIVLLGRLSHDGGSYDYGGLNDETLMDIPIMFDEMNMSSSAGEGGKGITSIRQRVLALFS